MAHQQLTHPATRAADDSLSPQLLAGRIVAVRGQYVLLDSDLAQLYGVETRNLNQAVKRNVKRFPADFMFTLTTDEAAALRSQTVISKRGGRRYAPAAFTEHGAIMAASVLNSDRAVEMSVYVVRAFVQSRQLLHTHQALEGKLAELEGRVTRTDHSLTELIDAIRAMMAQPKPANRPIGFMADLAEKVHAEPVAKPTVPKPERKVR
jgi:ORF6N domain